MKKSDLQNRLKSKVFWAGIIGAIGLLLKAFGIYEVPDQTADLILSVIMGLITTFGVANNPTNKNGF